MFIKKQISDIMDTTRPGEVSRAANLPSMNIILARVYTKTRLFERYPKVESLYLDYFKVIASTSKTVTSLVDTWFETASKGNLAPLNTIQAYGIFDDIIKVIAPEMASEAISLKNNRFKTPTELITALKLPEDFPKYALPVLLELPTHLRESASV